MLSFTDSTDEETPGYERGFLELVSEPTPLSPSSSLEYHDALIQPVTKRPGIYLSEGSGVAHGAETVDSLASSKVREREICKRTP